MSLCASVSSGKISVSSVVTEAVVTEPVTIYVHGLSVSFHGIPYILEVLVGFCFCSINLKSGISDDLLIFVVHLSDLDTLLLKHEVGCSCVVPVIFVEGLSNSQLSSKLDSFLIFSGKCVPSVHVDHNAVNTSGLVPSRSTPVRAYFLKLQGIVSPRTGELTSVDNASLEGLIKFCSCNGCDVDSKFLSNFTSKYAAKTDLHALHVIEGFDGLVGTDTGLSSGKSDRIVLDVVLIVYVVVAIKSATFIEPVEIVSGVEVIDQSGKDLECGILTSPIAAPVSAGLDSSVLNVVDQLSCCAKFAFSIVLNGELAVCELAYQFSKSLVSKEVDVSGTPGGSHLPCYFGKIRSCISAAIATICRSGFATAASGKAEDHGYT